MGSLASGAGGLALEVLREVGSALVVTADDEGFNLHVDLAQLGLDGSGVPGWLLRWWRALVAQCPWHHGLGLRRRMGSIVTESRTAPLTFLHTQMTVILWRDALDALVYAFDAPMCPAALGTDRLSSAAACGVAEALAVVALLALPLGCRRWWWRGGGPRSLAGLDIGLAGVLGSPTPFAALLPSSSRLPVKPLQV